MTEVHPLVWQCQTVVCMYLPLDVLTNCNGLCSRCVPFNESVEKWWKVKFSTNAADVQGVTLNSIRLQCVYIRFVPKVLCVQSAGNY